MLIVLLQCSGFDSDLVFKFNVLENWGKQLGSVTEVNFTQTLSKQDTTKHLKFETVQKISNLEAKSELYGV